MNEYTLTLESDSWIDFAPETLEAEVQQNLRTIVTTTLGSAPGSRNVGVDYELTDEPVNIVQARITGAVMAAVMEQEPRVQIREVTFLHQSKEHMMYGRILPVIRYSLVEEGS